MARHLVEDDDATFMRYAAGVGLDAISAAYCKLFMAPGDMPDTEYLRIEAAVGFACRRLARALAEEYAVDAVSRRFSEYVRRPLAERRRIVAWTSETARLARAVMPLDVKAARCQELITEAHAFGLSSGEPYGIYCELLPRLHREAELQQALEQGIHEAELAGDYGIACQMLGQLGVLHKKNNDPAAMRSCWDRALDHARRIKSWQEARILGFYATYYWGQGQLALSRECLLQAERRCYELHADRNEMRFLVQSMERFSSLECWSVVDRELQTVDALLQRSRDVWDSTTAQAETARIELLRSERLAAGGDCDRSAEYLESIQQRMRTSAPSPWRESLRLDVADIMIHCKRESEAESVLTAGREACERYHIPELLPAFDMQIAAQRLRMGDTPAAIAALRRFRDSALAASDSVTPLWVQYDVCMAEAALQVGDRRSASESFRRGLGRAVLRFQRLGTSPEAYLAWTEAQPLRELGHRILGDDARAGYAFEMAWRRLRAGGERAWRPAVQDDKAFRSQLSREAAGLERTIADTRTMHCVYGTFGGSFVRWTAFEGRVERDTLSVTPAALDTLIAALRAALWRPGSKDALVQQASWPLARALLPPELFGKSTVRRFLVSGDGPLTGLPFAALSVSSERFDPLVVHCDVATLRFHTSPAPPATGPPLIVYEPRIAPGLSRQFPFLQEPLPRAALETAHARSVMPGAVMLHDAAATKGAVLLAAASAPVVYLASHIVQDPEVPYVAFIPLTPAESARLDDAYLELSDIRGADLSHCQLAVLSGCGSGRAYASTVGTCPSLGEALVDAGVRAAVHTYADVRDRDAETLMVQFLDALQNDSDPVIALAVAQRRAYEAALAPAVWAAYSITLGTLTPVPASPSP